MVTNYLSPPLFHDVYLAHHGILGMKWGVRRYQNPDGTLTEAGRKRYAVREGGITLYTKHGMSKEEAEKAAEKRQKMMDNIVKGAAIGLGTAALAGGAYVLYKGLGENFIDKTIKAGTTIQTLSKDANRMRNGEAFYTAYVKKDKAKYLMDWGGDAFYGYKYINTAKAADNVKVASINSGRKTFNELLSNKGFSDWFKKNGDSRLEFFDGSFKRSFEKFKKGDKLSKHDINKLYNLFNTNLVDHDLDAKVQQSKFYGLLKTKGYGGVIDINDVRNSGYGTKAPTIIFDAKQFIQHNSVLNSQTTIDKARDDLFKMERGRRYVNYAIGYASIHPGVAGAVGATAALSPLAALGAYDVNTVNKHKKKASNYSK